MDPIVYFKQHSDSRGCLTVAQDEIPFKVERLFWITDVPEGMSRGNHMHKTCNELVVAVTGAFTMVIDDGTGRKSYRMDSPGKGIIISAGVWCWLEDFAPGTVLCVAASEKYNEEGYVR